MTISASVCYQCRNTRRLALTTTNPNTIENTRAELNQRESESGLRSRARADNERGVPNDAGCPPIYHHSQAISPAFLRVWPRTPAAAAHRAAAKNVIRMTRETKLTERCTIGSPPETGRVA